MVKRHPHADRDEVHVWMLDHFVRVGKGVGNSEMFCRFVCGLLAARADRRDLELRKRAQGRNVGIAPPAAAHTCSNDANTDFFCRHDVFFLKRALYSQVDSVLFFLCYGVRWLGSFRPRCKICGPLRVHVRVSSHDRLAC